MCNQYFSFLSILNVPTCILPSILVFLAVPFSRGDFYGETRNTLTVAVHSRVK